MYISDYDIKKQQRQYKAEQNKADYIENLSNTHKSVNTVICKEPLQTDSLSDFYNPKSKIDNVNLQQYTLTSLYNSYLSDPMIFCGLNEICQQLNVSMFLKGKF